MATYITTTVYLGGPYPSAAPSVHSWQTEGYPPHAAVDCGDLRITATVSSRDDHPDGAAELRKLAAALLDAADQLDDLSDVAARSEVA